MDRRGFLAAAAAAGAAAFPVAARARATETFIYRPGERYVLEPPVVDPGAADDGRTPGQALHELRDREVVIEGNGAILEVPRNYSGTERSTVFALSNCSLKLRNLTLRAFAEDNAVPGTHSRGVQWFEFTDACSNIEIENVVVTGGRVIFGFGVRSGEPRDAETVNVSIRNCVFEDSHYPVLFTGGGRLIRAAYRTRRATRSLFVRNVRDCVAEVWSEDHHADDVLLSADNATGYDAKSLEDVQITYHSPGAASSRFGVTLRFSASGEEGAVARNIRVVADVGPNVTPFRVVRQFPSDLNGGGAPDQRFRGHVLENLALGL